MIESSFEEPDIDGNTSPRTAEIEFTLIVSPCTVTTFEAESDISGSEVLYTLGEGSFEFGNYEFKQEPDCGYEQTYTVFNLPDEELVVHDSDQQKFLLSSSNDLEYMGVYQVVIRAEFQQPQILGGYSTTSQTIEFDLIIQPCTVE